MTNNERLASLLKSINDKSSGQTTKSGNAAADSLLSGYNKRKAQSSDTESDSGENDRSIDDVSDSVQKKALSAAESYADSQEASAADKLLYNYSVRKNAEEQKDSTQSVSEAKDNVLSTGDKLKSLAEKKQNSTAETGKTTSETGKPTYEARTDLSKVPTSIVARDLSPTYGKMQQYAEKVEQENAEKAAPTLPYIEPTNKFKEMEEVYLNPIDDGDNGKQVATNAKVSDEAQLKVEELNKSRLEKQRDELYNKGLSFEDISKYKQEYDKIIEGKDDKIAELKHNIGTVDKAASYENRMAEDTEYNAEVSENAAKANVSGIKDSNTKKIASLLMPTSDGKYLYDSASELDRLANGSASASFSYNDAEKLRYLSQTQRDTLMYYLGKGDYDSFSDYYGSISESLDEKLSGAIENSAYDMANNNWLAGVAGGVATSFIGGVSASAGAIKNFVNYSLDPDKYTGDNAYSAYNIPTRISESMQKGFVDSAEETAAKLSKDNPTAKEIARSAAEMGYSGAQSLAAMEIGIGFAKMFGSAKVGSIISNSIMSAASAGSNVVSNQEKGIGTGKVLANAAITGMIEYATNDLPVDDFIDLVIPGKRLSKSSVIDELKEMFSEGTQEYLSEVAENIMDVSLNGDKSDYMIYQNGLIADGMSEEEAKKAANQKFFVENPWNSFAAGAITGGLIGSVGIVQSHLSANFEVKVDDAFTTQLKQLAANSNDPAEILQSIKDIDASINEYQEEFNFNYGFTDAAKTKTQDSKFDTINKLTELKTTLNDEYVDILAHNEGSNAYMESYVNLICSVDGYVKSGEMEKVDSLIKAELDANTEAVKRIDNDLLDNGEKRYSGEEYQKLRKTLLDTSSTLTTLSDIIKSGKYNSDTVIGAMKKIAVNVYESRAASTEDLKNILTSYSESNQNLSNKTCENIINDPNLLDAFYRLTGKFPLGGTMAERRKSVKTIAAEYRISQIPENAANREYYSGNKKSAVSILDGAIKLAKTENNSIRNDASLSHDEKVSQIDANTEKVKKYTALRKSIIDGTYSEPEIKIPETQAKTFIPGEAKDAANASVTEALNTMGNQNAGQNASQNSDAETKSQQSTAQTSENAAQTAENVSQRTAQNDETSKNSAQTASQTTTQSTTGTRLETYAKQLSDALGKYGINVQTAALSEGENGKYDAGSKTIFLSDKLSPDKFSVAWHEIFHFAQDADTKLVPDTISAMKELGSYDDGTYSRTEKLYKDHLAGLGLDAETVAKTVTKSYIEEEICADFMKKIADETNSDLAETFAEKKPGLLKRLWNAVKRFVTHSSGESKADAKDIADGLRTLIEKYSGVDMGRRAGETGRSNTNSNVKLSINPDFASQYDAWDKKSSGGFFHLGTTSDALQSIGIDPAKIIFNKSKILQIKSKHPEITDNIFKQIPNILENPICVLQSMTKANRIVIFGELIGENSNPINAILELKPNGDIDGLAVVASVYSRNISNVQYLIDTSDILYLDENKKRTDTWLQTLRLQLPAGVDHYGSINSVTYSDENVNGEIVNKSETPTAKTDMQLAFEKAEKKSNDTKYSLEYTTENRPVAVIDEDILAGVKQSEWAGTVKREMADRFPDGIYVYGKNIRVNLISRNEYTNSNYSKKTRDNQPNVYSDKLKSASKLNDVVLASTNYVNQDLKHERNDNFIQFAHGNVLIDCVNTKYEADVIVGYTTGGNMVLYDIVDFKPKEFKIKAKPTSADQTQDAQISIVNSADTTIPQSTVDVNSNSMQKSENDSGAKFSLSGNENLKTAEELDAEYMNAVENGDMAKAQRMVEDRAEALNAELFAMADVPTYSVRRTKPPAETQKVYKVFTVSDSGKPSALFVSSKYELPVGVWLDAQDTWHFKADNGKYYVPSTQNPWTKGGKTGGMVAIPDDATRAELIKRGYLPENSKAKSVVALAYRPGWHAGDLPYFPQGGMKQAGSNYENIHRYNQVVFECELSADTDYTEYARNQEKAKNKNGETVNARADMQEMPKDGFYKYSTNPMTQNNDLGNWYIGGSLKIGRALTQEECDNILKENGRLPQEWENGSLDLDALNYNPDNTDEKRKLPDAVTYDDNGKVIPLSQRFNKEISDQRYSLEGDDDIIRENAKLKAQNEKLRGQFKRTENVTTDKAKVRAYAADLAKSNYIPSDAKSIDALASRLQTLYDKMANAAGKNGENAYSWEEINSDAAKISSDIVDSALVKNDESYREYKELRERLRTTPMYLPTDLRSDISGYESYEDMRKSNFGRLKISDSGESVDSVYAQLCEEYPEFFSESVDNAADQLVEIISVLDALKPVYENPFSANLEDAKDYLTNSIIENFFTVPQTKPTFADKAERKVTEAKISGAKKLEAEKAKSEKAKAAYESKLDAKDETIKSERWKSAENDLAWQIEMGKAVSKEQNKREAAIAEWKTKFDNAIQKERERRETALEKLKTRYLEKDAKGKTAREAAILRKQARNGIGKLTSYVTHPSDTKHVPPQLLKAAAEFVSQFDDKAELAKSQSAFLKAQASTEKLLDAIARGENDVDSSAIDPELSDMLSQVREDMADAYYMQTQEKNPKSVIHYLDNVQLKNLNDTIKSFFHAIYDYDKLVSSTLRQSVSEAANGIIEENQSNTDFVDKKGAAGTPRKLLKFDMLTPETFFETLGPTFYSLYQNVHDGQDSFVEDVKDASDYISEQLKKLPESDVDLLTGKTKKSAFYKFEDGSGIDLNLGQVMSLYLLSKREQAYKHLTNKYGGVIADRHNNGARDIVQNTPVKLTQEKIESITGKLTDAQKKFADSVSEYFTDTAAGWGNEVSRTLYGYDKFTEKNYFPINTKSEFNAEKHTDKGTDNGRRLKNLGMTKQVAPGASNPLLIRGVLDVFDSHVSDMAAYHSYVVPLTNFERVFNFTSEDGGVRTALQKKFGNNAADYIRGFLNDINGAGSNREVGAEIPNGLIRNFKRASVALNLSVAVKQPLSIVRAASVIDTKYLLEGVGKLKNKGIAAEMLKYSSIAQIKDCGFSDTGRGKNIRQLYDKNATRGIDKLLDYMSVGAAKADEVTWCAMWEAAKAETNETKPELKKGTSEYFSAVSERFGDIIAKTQVVSTIFDTSPLMRSKNTVVQMETAFMNEPTKTYNNLCRSFYELKQNPNSKSAKLNVTTAITTTVLNSVLTSLVTYAFRMLRNGFKDDDDDKTIQGFLKEIGIDTASDLLSMIPFVKSAVNLLSGYDIERIDYTGLEMIADGLVRSGKDLWTVIQGGAPARTAVKDITDIASGIGYVTGIPVKTLIRGLKAVANDYAIAADNTILEYSVEKLFTQVSGESSSAKTSFYDILYKAYDKGDLESYSAIRRDMIANGIDEDTISDNMRKRYSDEFDRAYDELYGKDGSDPDYKEFAEKTEEELGISQKKTKNEMLKRREDDFTQLALLQNQPDKREEYQALVNALRDTGMTSSEIKSGVEKNKTAIFEKAFDELYKTFSGTDGGKAYDKKYGETSALLQSYGYSKEGAQKAIVAAMKKRKG